MYYTLYSEHLHIVNILSETDSLLILKSVSPYSGALHLVNIFAAANGVHYMESLLYYTPDLLLPPFKRSGESFSFSRSVYPASSHPRLFLFQSAREGEESSKVCQIGFAAGGSHFILIQY